MKVKSKKRRHYIAVEVTPEFKKQLQLLANKERRKLAQYVRVVMEEITQRALNLPMPDDSRSAHVRSS
jgi:mRNA-degrading endonuclease RelE of RelBE toxin-antitoxin system